MSRLYSFNNPKLFFIADILFLASIAYLYLYYWINPYNASGDTIVELFILLVLELFLAHASTTFAYFHKQWGALILIPFYLLMGWIFYALLSNPYILLGYSLLVIARTRFALFPHTEEDISELFDESAMTFQTYFFVILATILFHYSGYIPEFGLTQETLQSIGYTPSSTTGVVFIEHPETVMCIGTLYYGAICIETALRFIDDL